MSDIKNFLTEINDNLERKKSDSTIATYAKVYKNHIQKVLDLKKLNRLIRIKSRVLNLTKDKGKSTQLQILSVIKMIQLSKNIEMDFNDNFEDINKEIPKEIITDDKDQDIFTITGTLDNIIEQVKCKFNDRSQLNVLRHRLDEIKDPHDKILFSLLLNYPSLRSDYSSIKFNDFEDNENFYIGGTIFFNNLVKVKSKIEIKLTKEDNNLIKTFISDRNSNFLFNNNNSDSFRKYVARLSVKYFDKKFTLNDFRKLHSCNPFKKIFEEQMENARLQNHSLVTRIRNYM